MRMDFVQRQRRWETEQARSAPLLPSDPLEEDEEMNVPNSSNAMQVSQSQPYASQYSSMPEEEADEVAQREREELEALLSYLPGEEEEMTQLPELVPESMVVQAEQPQEHFGSDDDDYDALFSDLMHEEAHTATGDYQQQQQQENGGDEMDMS